MTEKLDLILFDLFLKKTKGVKNEEPLQKRETIYGMDFSMEFEILSSEPCYNGIHTLLPDYISYCLLF